MEYRNLSNFEIEALLNQHCTADDWDNVLVADGFNHDFVHSVAFSGIVKIGAICGRFTLPGGVEKPSGMRNVRLHNVTIGNNCRIENVHNYIANYTIGDNTFIENVDVILVDEKSRFGNATEVSVLN